MKRKLLSLSMFLCVPVFAQVTQTQLIDYKPAIPPTPVKEGGVCWNTSFVVPRFGAWACGAGKETFDPCFSQANVSNAVVCGANPVHNQAGFRLNLSQPLPFSLGVPALPGEAWILKLENGLICTATVGSAKIIQGVGRIAFICEESGLPSGVFSGILSEMNLGRVWNAHWVHYTMKNGQYTLQTDLQQVNLQTVWR